MKRRAIFQIAFAVTLLAVRANAQVPASQDTIFIAGGTFSAGENAGVLETTINGDTITSGADVGARINPNRVYALYEGQVYFQQAPIKVFDSRVTLIIVGVPDPAHPSAKAKPIILIKPTGSALVSVNGSGVNEVYGSIKLVNIQYQAKQLDNQECNELFYCGTSHELPQRLIIDNCLFEFCNIDLFDCSNESGAIGGWPYGASFFITNSYFRNMFSPGQWWGSRIFQCKHPIDTLWVENCTITTAGLTFLQQNELTDFTYINHNTIVNNKKYWLLSPYKHNEFITNNIFINQNWVGEDTNVITSWNNGEKMFTSTIDVDSNTSTNGLVVQPKYMIGGDTADIDQALLGLSHLRIFVSNNINYYDSLLIKGYYTSPAYLLADTGTSPNTGPFNAIPSYLQWFYPGAQKVENIPGEWMNFRTQALFKAYAPPNGGFVEQETGTEDPGTATPGIASAAVVTAMAQWNQNQYGDPRFSSPSPALTSTPYIYGDFDAATLPGIVGGVKTDGIIQSTPVGAADQVGISKFTDLTENFSQSSHMSTIDGLPIGSLIWDDAKIAAYNSATDWEEVVQAWNMAPLLPQPLLEVNEKMPVSESFALLQNYPNPFNPATDIVYTLPQGFRGFVTVKVYNVLGQEVATLFAGDRTAGTFTVTFDAARFASGVYFYRLDAGRFTSVRKMLLLK